MITLLKVVAAAGIAWGVLNPSFTPRAENCECKGKADTKAVQVPRSDAGCSCKADTKAARLVPRSDAGCSCKADTKTGNVLPRSDANCNCKANT
jgi:hypothetical protein